MFSCPKHDSPLVGREGDSTLICPDADCRFSTEEGIYSFLENKDDFYEGAYLNQIHFVPDSDRLRDLWPLWFIQSGYLWHARNHVPSDSIVVELGCAGGVKYFADQFRMIGFDLSRSSLRAAAEHYETCIQADAMKTWPLQDESVDAIFSSFFWEHIPESGKKRILQECWRTLRPGGKLLFLYDVHSVNPLVSWLRRREPHTYQREFIEKDGHLGYQTFHENAEVFESAGFTLLEHIGLERTIVPPLSVLKKMRNWEGPPRYLGELSRGLEHPWLNRFHTAAVRALDHLSRPVLPAGWSRIAITVAQKGDL